jgi:phosphatidylinositol alpha-1,6-mannosyltransferase
MAGCNRFEMSGKRILIISSEYPPGPGGIGHHAYSLSFGLHRFGHHVEVMTVSDYATEAMKKDFDDRQPFKITRYPRIGWRTYARRIAMTLNSVTDGGFDWVFLTGKFALWTGLVLKILKPGLKTLAILHGSEVRPSSKWMRALTNRAVDSCDKVVAVSSFTASLLPASLRESKSPVIIPNGIDYAGTPDGGMQEEKLGGHPCLLTVGHVSPRKGQHRVIRALPVLAEVFPEVHYHMVGRPIQRERLEGLAATLGVSDRITFHGVAPTHGDLETYYKRADTFMLLSENQPNGDVEGFGIVALEANHFGVPVVGAKGCGVVDAVSEGESGYLVNGDDPEEITQAVSRCMESQNSLRESARKWARRHEWDAIIPHYERLLH